MNRKTLAILVADPDKLTSDTIGQMLKARGHAVTVVTDIVSGLKVIDMVLFDALVVPVDKHHSMMDLSFIDAAKKKQPDIKVLGISGDVNEPTSISTAAIDGFLRKPFTLDQLDDKLCRTAADRSAAA